MIAISLKSERIQFKYKFTEKGLGLRGHLTSDCSVTCWDSVDLCAIAQCGGESVDTDFQVPQG